MKLCYRLIPVGLLLPFGMWIAAEPARAQEPGVKPGPDKVKELITVLAQPRADSTKLEQTQQAIAELVRIGPPAVPQLVKAILGDHPTAAPYSALALDEIGKPAVEAVRDEWKKLGESDRWKLMRFRGKYDYSASLDFALKSLDSKSDSIAAQAVRYLGGHKEAKARGPLLKMLNTAAPRVRWDVVDTLGEIGGDEVIDPLIELLDPGSWAAKGEGQTPPDGFQPPWWPDGRPRVIAVLGKLKARKAALPLVRVLREKGPGRAYLGSVIIPILVELGVRECSPELRRIAAADPQELFPDLVDAKSVQKMAEKAVRHLEGDK